MLCVCVWEWERTVLKCKPQSRRMTHWLSMHIFPVLHMLRCLWWINFITFGLYQNLKITYAMWISVQCMSHGILSCKIQTVINLCGKLIQSYCEISSLWKFQHIWYTAIIRTSTTNHEHSGLSMQHHKYTRLLTLLFWTPLCVESRGSFLAVTRGKWSCHTGLREVPACVEDDNLYLME